MHARFLILLFLVVILISPVLSHCWTENYNCRNVKKCKNVYLGKECHYETKCEGGYVKTCKEYGCVKYREYSCNCRDKYCTREYSCCEEYGKCCHWTTCHWWIFWYPCYKCETCCKKEGTCTEKYVCGEECDTCKECEEYGCLRYGYEWDPCKTKKKVQVCEDKYEKRCYTKRVCDTRTVCDAKPVISLSSFTELYPDSCFDIKIDNLETPYKAKLEVSLGEFTLFSGVINSNKKRICINDTLEPGTKELIVKVWDLSDDPSYDKNEFKKFVKFISDPIVYDMKICYGSYCGVTFAVPETGFTFYFKTKYTDSVDILFGNRSIKLSGKNISVFLNGSGVLKVIARNKYRTKVYEYGEIRAYEVGEVPFFEGREGGGMVDVETVSTILTVSSAALGVYLGRRLEDYIRSVILRFVPVSSDFWRESIVEVKDGVVSLTSVGRRYIERIKRLFSLREVYTRLREISGNAWRNLLELFNSFKTKVFSAFYEFKYKDLYARYGFNFVESLRRKYGERAIKVLKLGLEDKEFIEWVLENRLEGYGKDLKYLYGVYREIPRDLVGYAIKILKYTGRRDFLRFLLRSNLLKEVGNLDEKGLRNALSVYSMGESEFLRVYRRFGISGIGNALIGRSVHRYSVRSVRVVSVKEKILDDWDKTVYVVRDLERGSSEIKVVEKDVKIDTRVVVYPRKVSNNIEYEDYRNMITLERIPEKKNSYSWVDNLIHSFSVALSNSLFTNIRFLISASKYIIKRDEKSLKEVKEIMEEMEENYRRKKELLENGKYFEFTKEMVFDSAIGEVGTAVLGGMILGALGKAVSGIKWAKRLYDIGTTALAGYGFYKTVDYVYHSEDPLAAGIESGILWGAGYAGYSLTRPWPYRATVGDTEVIIKDDYNPELVKEGFWNRLRRWSYERFKRPIEEIGKVGKRIEGAEEGSDAGVLKGRGIEGVKEDVPGFGEEVGGYSRRRIGKSREVIEQSGRSAEKTSRSAVLGRLGEKIAEKDLLRNGHRIILTDELYTESIGKYTKSKRYLPAIDIFSEKGGDYYATQVKYRTNPEGYILGGYLDKDIQKMESFNPKNFLYSVSRQANLPESSLEPLYTLAENYGGSKKTFYIIGVPRSSPEELAGMVSRVENLGGLDSLNIITDPFYLWNEKLSASTLPMTVKSGVCVYEGNYTESK